MNARTVGIFAGFSLFLLSNEGMAQWTKHQSGTTERLRGVSAVGPSVVWASGNHGTIVRSTDGGNQWQSVSVPGSDSLDFRDVDAMTADVAYVLSIGEGEKSRIYKTTDGGSSWSLSFRNTDPRGFYDSMAFWNEQTGVAVGDAVDGRISVIRTTNAGKSWVRVQPDRLPESLPGEGAFAASGTCVSVFGTQHAWIGTGVNCARVYSSTDQGVSWTVASVPLASSSNSSGVFSVLFTGKNNGIVVGGDYRKLDDASGSVAVSADGGKTWRPGKGTPSGFRSCVAVVPGTKALVAVGPSGSDYSMDNGFSWTQIDTTGFHAVNFAGSSKGGWAVGEAGTIARFTGSFGEKK